MHRSPNRLLLYDQAAQRRYLNAVEVERFLAAAAKEPPHIRLFAETLAYTGARISEALLLRGCDIQLSARAVSIQTLKRRAPTVREVPIVAPFAASLKTRVTPSDEPIWRDGERSVPRGTAYRWIKAVMREAGIAGPKACPHGLRHAFGVRAVMAQVPLNMVQQWMGHASMETTAIYATVLGPEQLELAERMWG